MFVTLLCIALGTSFVNGLATAETIQCYCNLPECESASNRPICTVEGEDGGCFSDFLDYRDFSRARQGCLHLLPKSKQDLCGNAPGSTGAPRSLLLCCQVSMCNQLTHSIIGSFLNATERRSLFGLHDDSANHVRDTSKEGVLVTAATVLVPICAVMIVIILIVLTCRCMMSNENVVPDKFRRDVSNATADANQYTSIYLKVGDTKTVPLLSSADYRQNCEDFRSITSTRIHYGQHVNVLRENSGRPEKNVEYYAKVNADRQETVESTAVVVEADAVDNVEEVGSTGGDENAASSASDNLDVRVVGSQSTAVPSLSLNLDKLENVDSCNFYQSPRLSDDSSVTEVCIKVYEKNLL